MVELFADSLPLLVFIAGIILTAAEAVIPGAHFIVLGIALMIAGLFGLVFGPLGTPLGIALVTLVAGGATFWAYRNLDLYGGQGKGRTADSESLKGVEGRVTERVTMEGGEVKLDDGGFNPFYRARTIDEEIPVGTRVMVIDPGGGNVVTVTPIEVLQDDIDRELAAERARRANADADETRETDEREFDAENT